jgi:hypothetical protein
MHIQEWWYSYQLKSVDMWTLQFFLLVIMYPINLYILAHLLFPAGLSKEFSSKEFYLAHYPRIFIGASMLVIISIVQNVVVSGYAITAQIPQFLVFVVLAFILITKEKNSMVHTVVSVILLLMMIVGFALDQENLTIH